MQEARPMTRRKHETEPRTYYVDKTKPVEDYTPYLDPDRGLTKEKYQQICNNMITRCYNEHLHERLPDYEDCEMCLEWLESREKIVQWINEEYYMIPIPGEQCVQLDKDILIKGNKLYSPETCLFVPASVNSFFTPNRGKMMKTRDLPTGVYESPSGKYFSMIKPLGEKRLINLGTFDSPEQAWTSFKGAKELKRQQLAKYYQPYIPGHVYDAIMAYQFEITD